MTDDEQSLFWKLPQKWQELVLAHEAKEWIKIRESCIASRNSFEAGGLGHMSLKPELVDSSLLFSPLREQVESILSKDEGSAMRPKKLGNEFSNENLLKALNSLT
jgi:hypothetical protein